MTCGLEKLFEELSMTQKAKNAWKYRATTLAFVSPWLIGFTVFILLALANSLYYSFTAFNLFAPPKWIGWYNFASLFRDDIFIKVLRNTAYYTAIAFVVNFSLSLVLAIFLYENERIGNHFTDLFKVVFFLPYVIPLVAYAVVWKFMYNPDIGIINYLIKCFGGSPLLWLNSMQLVKPAILISNALLIGQQMIIFFAGLQDIPQTLFDSCKIDGANALQRLRHVIVPLLSPVMLFNAILLFIRSFQVFALPLIMTETSSSTTTTAGGPAHASTFYLMYLYDTAFTRLDMGYASAMAWIMFILLLLLSGIFIYIDRKHTFYMGE
jgi:multiple sugar transport system permease protein